MLCYTGGNNTKKLVCGGNNNTTNKKPSPAFSRGNLTPLDKEAKLAASKATSWGGRSRCTGRNGGERGAAELQTDKVASHETGATDAENPSCHGCRAVSFKVRKITCHLRLLEVELRGDGGGAGGSRVILRNCFNNGAEMEKFLAGR